jgi:CRISPR-associated protein Cmr6
MPLNASHFYYVHSDNKETPTWSKNLHKKNIKDLLGFTPFDLTSKINNQEYKSFFKHPKALAFPLEVIYPGLIIGAGYAHPALDKEDYQIGFYFDHTTGLPIIPGSSVKGVLKNAFPVKNEKFFKEKENYIVNKMNKYGCDFEIYKKIWEEICFMRKQVFLDAYISGVGEKGIFADDSLAPHPDLFKEPIPIKFLKIMPGVKFTFQFILYDYEDDKGKILVDKASIMNIFKDIIEEFGIGAKRNSYGAFKSLG